MYEDNIVHIFAGMNNIVFEGSVVEFTGNTLIIWLKKFNAFIRENSKVCVTIYDRTKGEMEYACNVKRNTSKFIVLDNVRHLRTTQRRLDTRVDISFPLIIQKLYIDNQRPVTLEKKIQMQALNLSSSGILLYSKLNMPVNIGFYLEIPIEEEKISCIAEQVRKERTNNGYYYGCRFASIEDGQKDRIRRYVYRKQVEHKKGEFIRNISTFE